MADRAPGKLDVFTFADYGVQLSRSLIRRKPGEWTELANGQPSYIFGLGAVEKRGGMLALNEDVLAGPVLAMSNVPLTSLFDGASVGAAGLYIAIGGPPYWAFTTDLVVVTNPATLGAVESVAEYAASSASILYFTDDAARIARWNGSTVVTAVAAASWPDIGAAVFANIADMVYSDGSLYVLCAYDDGLYYALKVVVATGVITVLSGTAIHPDNCNFGGIYASSVGVLIVWVHSTVDNFPYIYTTDLAFPGSWSQERVGVADERVMCVADHAGDVYAGTQCPTVADSAEVWQRSGGGWGSVRSFTANPAGTSSAVAALASFDGDLFAVFGSLNVGTVTYVSQLWTNAGGWAAVRSDLAADFSMAGGSAAASIYDGLCNLLVFDGRLVVVVTGSPDEIGLLTTAAAWSLLSVGGVNFTSAVVG